MKTLLLGLFLICAVSCGKDKQHCYECDVNNNGVYRDVGCYTKDEWENLKLTDDFGTEIINKDQRCRRK